MSVFVCITYVSVAGMKEYYEEKERQDDFSLMGI